MNFKEKMQKIFENNKISINNEQIDKFELYYNNLIETNKIHNLTAITEENEVITKHFLDSVLIIDKLNNQLNSDKNHINNQSNSSGNEKLKILDIGCGAGFPSIPLAIMNKNFHFTAIDSVEKKVDFVNTTIRKINLQDNYTAIHTRIEDLASSPQYRESFDVVVSRAVAPLNIILEYSAPFLKNGGYIYSYKGSNYNDELDKCNNALKILDCEISDIYEYNIPELDTKRYILKIRKNSKISTKYPRKQNKPRTNPL